MNVPTLCAAAAAALLLCFAGNALAANPGKTTAPQTRSLPALVSVDASGNVTEIIPAFTISTQLKKALRKTLNEMITQPAHNKKGKAIACQFAMIMALKPVKQKSGTYAVHFSYVSAKPLPPGQWVWRYDGRKYALVNMRKQIMVQRVVHLNKQAQTKAAWARQNHTSPINY